MDDRRLFTVEEAAERLRIPVGTLRDWRYRGKGPKSFRQGRHVFYHGDDLDAWIQACREGAASAS